MLRTLWVIVGVALVLGITSVATGAAPRLITGRDVKDHTLSSADLIDRTIQNHDLSRPLVASLRGQQGPAGIPGATGATGPQGLKGDTGAKGEKGDTGATGARGLTGAKGDKGDTGAPGPTGETGAQGPKGDQGPPGIVNAVKAAFCLDTTAGTMTFMPGVWPSGISCGIGKVIVNVFIEG